MKFKEMPYERIDFDEVQKELKELMEAFDAAKSGEEQFAIHQKYYKLTGRVDSMYTIANIRFDIDTSDAFYEKEHEYYDEKMPEYSNVLLAYQKKLYESPFRDYLEKKIGPVAFKNMEIAQKAMDEKLIPLMQEENALTMEYDKLIASAKINFDGKELNLSLMRPYLIHQDRNVRAAAWKEYSAFFEANADKLDEIYDKLVKNRTAQAKKMGYDNYLELGYYRMGRNCYGRKEVEAYREQVKKDFVPFAEELHERRRKRLGLDKLSYIDNAVYFKDGNPAPFGTPEEILAAGQKMYGELSPETKEFMDFMMENELFDVIGRKTKKAGGYMTYIPDYQSPFVFANFNGTSGDVDVITHECGHAFQGYLSGKDPIREHADIGMETAEIIGGVVKETKPDVLIAVDALAARSIKRLNRTIQITNTGIQPGSGVGNHRNALTKETLGVPVIAIGIPTVVDAATIVGDALEKLMNGEKEFDAVKYMGQHRMAFAELNNMYMTGKDIDSVIKRVSYTVSEGINIAMEKNWV